MAAAARLASAFPRFCKIFAPQAYMPNARSILLLLLAAASLRSRKLEKSSRDTSPKLSTFKF
ncbi:hypothetical protein CAMRE0001_0064 [Campylobacter rectus RM3267]|uniref:Uncharacterized protein n=1 Tax=Campylobacter rectus RM3267 TaxID=553218 RepID=B9D3L0_CAMRE|nr:hypothetical protein CAMRE0001_0064 [Campylobacter rectus RM3267]